MRTYQRTARQGLPAVLVVLILGTAPLVAQERKRFVELSAAAAYQSFDNATDLNGSVGGLGRLGVWLPANFSLELAGSFAKPKTSPDLLGNTLSVNVKNFSISALYNILIGTRSSFYLKAGGGTTKYGSNCPSGSTSTLCASSGLLLGGAGFRVGITPTVMTRGEIEVSRNKSSSRNLSNFGANLGLSLMLGSKPIADDDSDGVQNNRDRCPDTPRGAQVDARGCPVDDDKDGVPNGLDRCPNTPIGAKVDTTGCPIDSDGDNVPDGLDKCPDTAPGVLVDPNGCPKDSDGDGVPDGLDHCPDTPKGASVDAVGCPGDEDGDGVLDGIDRCPRTPPGAAVLPNGCMAGQAPGQPAPSVSPTPAPDTAGRRARPGVRNPPRVQPPPPTQGQAPPPKPPTPGQAPSPTAQRPPTAATGGIVAGVIPGIGFAPGTARLSQASYVALDSIAQILIADPSITVEVSAHTDNSISQAEAMRLTGLQADAVRDYLVTRGVPYQQVVSKGYGSTIPRTPDTTPNGRAANRRVEIRVVVPGP